MLDPLYESNTELDQNISGEEIEKIIMTTKTGMLLELTVLLMKC